MKREALRHAVRELFRISPSITATMALEEEPGADSVASYQFTRGAENAWQAINRQLAAPTGRMFWIGGPAGCGKTHFVNYVLALDRRAGSLGGAPARRLTLAVAPTGPQPEVEIETRLFEAFAEALAADRRARAIWQYMPWSDALPMMVEQARRLGVSSITLAIDLGDGESPLPADFASALSRLSAASKMPKLIVLAAGRGPAPEHATAFDVGPAGANEMLTVAIGRARQVLEDGAAMLADFYRGVEPGGLDPEAIFPFHPASAHTLERLCEDSESVADVALMVREILSHHQEQGLNRLVFPADLMSSATVERRVEERLSNSGKTAFNIARSAAATISGANRAIAGQIVDTLVLEHVVSDGSPLPSGALQKLLAIGDTFSAVRPVPAIAGLMRELEVRSMGVIAVAGGNAIFDPLAAGAPEVTAFNTALPLLRRIDPSLVPLSQAGELKSAMKRLADAMANALEGAYRIERELADAMGGANAELLPAQRATLKEFAAVASAGAAGLIETGSDPASREEAAAKISAYESLAAVVAVLPRFKAMRAYLQATGLHADYEDDPSRDDRVTALETECQLLAAQTATPVFSGSLNSFDALEARFQKFKWTYVVHYRAAHEHWRLEMNRLADIATDALQHTQALERLNSIAALGEPAGADLMGPLAEVTSRIIRCGLSGRLSPEISPLCPECGYVLGTVSPRDELTDLFDRVRRALGGKLAALSRSAITRLIRQHDRGHRLDGFLKITQAAQTDALIRVLDADLARYLGRLLDESPESRHEEDSGITAATASSAGRLRRHGPKYRPASLQPSATPPQRHRR